MYNATNWVVKVTTVPSSQIELIRDASRRLVRELGFMREALAGTGLPPSSVHALLEIDARGEMTANELADLLALEKSSVSRLLRKLVDTGEIVETPGKADGRTKLLSLTIKGKTTVSGIHNFARRQVKEALGRLSPGQQVTIADGLRLYANALAAGRKIEDAPSAITIETGYRPGALARCTEMHAQYYARTAGFGRPFEAKVAAGLAEFSERIDRSCNGLWLAVREGEVVGTVAIDGEDLGSGIAHLRWFIIADDVRGQGVGRELLSAALEFCDRQGFRETHLWTFHGLDAARHLYETHGFSLAEEYSGGQWGKEVLEQRFVRPIGRAD